MAKLALIAAALLCLSAVARADGPAPDPTAALVNDQIVINYIAPNAPYLTPLYERMKKRLFLERLKQFLSPLKIPPGITLKISAKECGQTNSWWSGRRDGLFLCYEWADFAERVAPLANDGAGMTREDAILGALLQVTFHELGHAMFDIYDVPVFGREEDAADQMAGFILSQFGPEVAKRTFPGVALIWRALYQAEGEWPHDAFSDIHGHPLQRAYNYLCMAYGGNPTTFQYVVDSGLLPRERAIHCADESRQIFNAFAKTIYPHIDLAKMKIVQSLPWLAPEGQEIPSQN